MIIEGISTFFYKLILHFEIELLLYEFIQVHLSSIFINIFFTYTIFSLHEIVNYF